MSGFGGPERTTAQHAMDGRLPRPYGVGNDYGFLLPALARFDGEPRIRVSVIVPVYNRRAILEKTLAALCSQTYPHALFEVIVADDGSHDRPEEIVPQFRDALNIRIVRQEDEGFRVAAVRNLAIRASTGEVIASLDCDMLPVDGWLRAMVAPFHVYDGPLCTIGYRRNVDTTSLSAEEIRRDVRSVRRARRVWGPPSARVRWAPWLEWRLPSYWRTRMLRGHSWPFAFAAGANLAYRRGDAIAAGLHDESFRHWGCEDDEFAYRLYRRGAYFIPVPDALAYHQAHDVAVPREQYRQQTRRLLGLKVPQYRSFSNGEWETPLVSTYIRAEAADHARAPRAVESALAQTIPDLDVCVSVEDSATAVIDALAPYADHPRVRIVCSGERNVSARANAAVHTCNGDLILQMRADEELVPYAAARLYRALSEDSDFAMAFSGYEERDERDRAVGRYLPPDHSHPDHVDREMTVAPRMYRARDFWRAGGWNDSARGDEDADLLTRIFQRGLVQPVREILAHRQTRENLSNP